MRRSRQRGQRIAVVTITLGTVLLLAGGYLAFFHDSTAGTPAEAPAAAFVPQAPGPDDIPESLEDLVDPAKAFGGSNPFTTQSDPLKHAGGEDRIYTVTITLRSNGPMKYVIRTQEGYGKPASANGEVTITKRLRGPRAVAQAFVQPLGSESATCTMTIDGDVVSTATATKRYQVIACTG